MGALFGGVPALGELFNRLFAKLAEINTSSRGPGGLSIVNVTDPKEIHDAMGSEEGTRVIVNVIRNRRREIRSALG